MRGVLALQPPFILMMGVCALAMFVPAMHALLQDSHAEARAFFYAGLLLLILAIFIGVARGSEHPRDSLMHNLLALVAAYVVLPLALAVPFYEALRTTTFVNAYFEMVSSLTTTGATLYVPERLSSSLHLWRAMVGWMGGLLVWVSAAAVMAPLSLGGFEVTTSGEPGQSDAAQGRMSGVDPQARILRVLRILLPVYAGLTAVLWVLLAITGEAGFVALCHAMAVMATSGISPVGGLSGASAGVPGEMLLALFLLFALSRVTFSGDTLVGTRGNVLNDPEFRLGLVLVLVLPVLLVLRHWSGSFDVDATVDVVTGLRAFWGALFTILSVLTTTGFVSADWAGAQHWSGLDTPGLMFLGLAIIGGGVATTAGGVKLLRVWALYLQSLREMEKMVHPSSVGRSGGGNRRLRRQGAFVAWIFFMLFAGTITVFTVVLAGLTGSLEHGLVLTIAGLSTTGPLIVLAPETPLALAQSSPSVKMVLAAAMVIGRLEMLAIIALAVSDLWRR